VKKTLSCLSALAIVAASVLTASPALAGGGPGHSSGHHPGNGTPTAGTPQTVATGLVSPLSLEVGARTTYLSQNFTGVLSRVSRDGVVTEITSAPGFELGSVSARKHTVYYTQSALDLSSSVLLKVPTNGGTPVQLADLYAYEVQNNPDVDVTYGFQGLPADCVAQFPPVGPMSPPATYTGLVDSHPYATLALRRGVYVADAAANAILKVSYRGEVSTVALLPSQPAVQTTAEVLVANGYPACAAGFDFIAEPVPTDVEEGPDGWLYVSTLPGGFEDPALGARGSVYKVNPWTGRVVLLATGFATATGLAVDAKGTVYVSELFGGADGTGQISVLPKRATAPTPFVSVVQPTAIEVTSKKLVVSTNSLAEAPEAQLTVIPLRSRR
jgi:hypothetical protein